VTSSWSVILQLLKILHKKIRRFYNFKFDQSEIKDDEMLWFGSMQSENMKRLINFGWEKSKNVRTLEA